MSDENETRIALIIAGGVSLGSFEAGALAEILYQLETRNHSGDHRFVIDVITGGSAGSITGAMVGKILVEGNEASQRKMLHDSWVVDGDIGKILKLADVKTDKYVLPVALQHELAKKYLHPTSGATDQSVNIDAYFSLTNMSGVNYAHPYGTRNSPPDGMGEHLPNGFPTTRFQDGYSTTISASMEPKDWCQLGINVIASGANQGAFPPVALKRTLEQYPRAKAADNDAFQQVGDEVSFLFTDGGAFNNEPVREAFELARHRDINFTGKRRVILIDPYQNRFDDQQIDRDSVRWKPGYANKSESDRPTFVQNLVRLVLAFMANAEQKHWIYEQERVFKKNQRRVESQQAVIKLFNALRVLESDQQQAVIHGLGSLDNVSDAQAERIARQIEKYHENPPTINTEAEKSLFIHLIKALFGSTDLRKEYINLAVIRSFAEATAGDDVGAFAGFFKQSWRQYDYGLGRAASREVMNKLLHSDLAEEITDDPSGYGQYQYDIDPQFANAEIRDADETLRLEVYQYLKKKIKVLLKGEPLRAGWGFRFLFSIFIEPRLKEVLGIKRRKRWFHPYLR